MARETDYGFMLWDAKSKGTLSNVINLLKLNKPVAVYLSPTKGLHTLNSLQDLTKIMGTCDKSLIDTFEKLKGSSQDIQRAFWAEKGALTSVVSDSSNSSDKYSSGNLRR